MKTQKNPIVFTGDGKTRETAIYFPKARHRQEEEEFEAQWLIAHKIKYPGITDKKDECYGYDGPEGNYEFFEVKGADYLRYNTTKGEIWFKFDKANLPMKKYLNWLSESGL